MLKRIILTLLQVIFFGLLLLVGSFWAFIRLLQPSLAFIPVWRMHVSATHDYIANGLVFALVFLVLFLLMEALRRALRPWAMLSILAFVLALAVSLVPTLSLGLVSVVPASSSAP